MIQCCLSSSSQCLSASSSEGSFMICVLAEDIGMRRETAKVFLIMCQIIQLMCSAPPHFVANYSSIFLDRIESREMPHILAENISENSFWRLLYDGPTY